MNIRLETATRLRDAALSKLRAEGTLDRLGGTNDIGRILRGKIGALTMVLRTPFNRLPPLTEDMKYNSALFGRRPHTLPYGLDIWAEGGKVFFVEWNDEGEIDLVSFKRGEWEKTLIPGS